MPGLFVRHVVCINIGQDIHKCALSPSLSIVRAPTENRQTCLNPNASLSPVTSISFLSLPNQVASRNPHRLDHESYRTQRIRLHLQHTLIRVFPLFRLSVQTMQHQSHPGDRRLRYFLTVLPSLFIIPWEIIISRGVVKSGRKMREDLMLITTTRRASCGEVYADLALL